MIRDRILADLVVLVHVIYVLFVVGGWAAVVLGAILGWNWVRNFWYRLVHGLAIGVVAVQAGLGIPCPLTTLENSLRRRAGQATYPGDFVGYWLHELLFYEAPAWVFTASYAGFAAVVAATAWLVPPCSPWAPARNRSQAGPPARE